jgi:hypothetical protein
MSERMSVFSDACNHFSLVISLHGHCGYVYMQRDIGVRDDAHSLGGTGEPAGRLGRNYPLRNVLSRSYWLCIREALVVLKLAMG